MGFKDAMQKIMFFVIKAKAAFFRISFGKCDPSVVAVLIDAFRNPYLLVQIQQWKLKTMCEFC